MLFDVVDEAALGIEIVASACGGGNLAAGSAVGCGGFSLGGRFFSWSEMLQALSRVPTATSRRRRLRGMTIP